MPFHGRVVRSADLPQTERLMRTFEDTSGRAWDAAVSDESYGTQRIVFSVRGARELRSQELGFTSRFEAEQWLLEQDEEELRRLLTEAPAWHPGGGWRTRGGLSRIARLRSRHPGAACIPLGTGRQRCTRATG